MAKKKNAANAASEYYRARREEWSRKMVAADAAEKNKTTDGPALATKVVRQIPGRIIQIDHSKFTSARLGIIHQALSGELKWPLYLFGEVGRGKTYLAAAIYLQWPGPASAIWMPYTVFCERCDTLRANRELVISDGFRNFEFCYESWWQYFADAGLVVLDDLGVGEIGEARGWRNEWVIELLERRHKKPLILTGNLSFDNTDTRLKPLYGVFDDRVISRLREGRPIELFGRDLRAEEYFQEGVE